MKKIKIRSLIPRYALTNPFDAHLLYGFSIISILVIFLSNYLFKIALDVLNPAFYFGALILNFSFLFIWYEKIKSFVEEDNFNLVLWYEQTKKLLVIFTPLLLFIIILRYFEQSNLLSPEIRLVVSQNTFLMSTTALASSTVIILSLATFIHISLRADSKYAFVKSYLKRLSATTNDINYMKYFLKAISTYNEYIRKNLKTEFDQSLLFSRIAVCDCVKRRSSIESISSSFNGTDRLKPLEFLSMMLREEDKSKFFIHQKFASKLKDFFTIAIPVLTVIVAIIGLITGKA